MGLMDDLLKTGMSAMMGAGGQQQSGMAEGILELLGGSKSGGLASGLGGMVQMFTQKGMGDVVSSWVGTGQNMPISADQIRNVLGSDLVSSLASKAGVAPDMAGSMISQLLPMIVDKLTPEGKIPEGGGGSILEQGFDLLKGKLF